MRAGAATGIETYAKRNAMGRIAVHECGREGGRKMSATIHYLRPFEREDLASEEPQDPAIEETAAEPKKKRIRRRLMPCGRNSRFKKRMDGTVVPRERR